MSSVSPRFRRSLHSERCRSAEEYWDPTRSRCELCSKNFPVIPGKEFTPNCGLSDDGGRHEVPYKDCGKGTFNNGSFVWCQQCSTCPPSGLLSPCTNASDSRCCGEGKHVGQQECRDGAPSTTVRSTVHSTETLQMDGETSVPPVLQTIATTQSMKTSTYIADTKITTTPNQTYTQFKTTAHTSHPWTVVGVTLTILVPACLLCLFYIIMKKKPKDCRGIKRRFSQRSLSNHVPLADSREHFKPGTAEDIKDVNDFLSPEIQAAPLQSVLNNMDVVEELVLLLDPESAGVKSTRHLAASCSIPFTWINYAYSMKDSRSPLIAVLEKVIAQYPCWNVGHLAGLLSNIGRNDAVAVLGKLTVNADTV